MKSILAVFSLSLLSSLMFGQNADLPEILWPTASAESEGQELGGSVFKLLPRGTYENPAGTYKDEENPLGIRQGGSYFSFSTGSHSYNKIPQIELQKGGNLSVGFYGASYGMIAYLGLYPFSEISHDLPESIFLHSYKPPKLEKEIRSEAMSFHERRVDGLLFKRSVPAVRGHTYLLRAISFDEADILVAFTVLEIAESGVVTIAWKKLADFGKPLMLSMTDEDMKTAIEKIIADNGIFKGVLVDVKDNVLTLKGQAPRKELELFSQAGINELRIRGRTYSWGLDVK